MVTRHARGLKTEFRAHFFGKGREGGSNIGVNTECDALPGLDNHACRHSDFPLHLLPSCRNHLCIIGAVWYRPNSDRRSRNRYLTRLRTQSLRTLLRTVAPLGTSAEELTTGKSPWFKTAYTTTPMPA